MAAPKIEVTEPVPDLLRAFAVEVEALIAVAEEGEAPVGYEEPVRLPGVTGQAMSEDLSEFSVTLIPASDPAASWELLLPRGVLRGIAMGSVTTLPVWRCQEDSSCASRFSEPAMRCATCEPNSLLAALMGIVQGEPEAPDLEGALDGLTEAKRFLSLLVSAGHVELTGEGSDEAHAGLASALRAPVSVDQRLSLVWDWLMTEDLIEEVYASEDDLEALLREW